MTRSGLHPLWMQTFSFNLIVLNDTLGQLCSRCPLGKKSASMTWVMLRRSEIAPCTETHVFGLQNPVLLFLSHFIMCTSVHTFFKLLAHFYEAKTTSTKIIKMVGFLFISVGVTLFGFCTVGYVCFLLTSQNRLLMGHWRSFYLNFYLLTELSELHWANAGRF